MSREINIIETVNLLDNLSTGDAGNQRALARKIGISVGLVNALVHRAVQKGLVKVKSAPARRYAYYLTPKGFAEKSRLVAEYLEVSLSFFRTARQEYSDLFGRCAASGKTRIVLCGAGELAEIASLAASSNNVEILSVLDHGTNQNRVAGLPIIRVIDDVADDAVIVITDGRAPQQAYDKIAAAVGAERILTPSFLRISRGEDF